MDIDAVPASAGDTAPVPGITESVKQRLENSAKGRPTNHFVDPRVIALPRHVELGGKARKRKQTVRVAFISLPGLMDCKLRETSIPTCNGKCTVQGLGYGGCFDELAVRVKSRRDRPAGDPPERSCQRGLDAEAFSRAVCRWPANDWSSKWDEYKGALRAALSEHDADVVVVNELGIPITADYPPDEFFQEVGALANASTAVIIAGSFHDARTQLNTGYMFTPDPQWAVVPFHKRVRATRVNERISVVANRQATVVRAFGLSIGVLICLDLLDHASVAPLVGMRDKIDLILVPTHSESTEEMEKTARVVSRVMAGGVGVVNYTHPMEHYGSMQMFGKPKRPTGRTQLYRGAVQIRTYDIDTDDFIARKHHFKEDASRFAWMLRGPVVSIAE